MHTRVVFSQASDEWATPHALFDALHQEFGFVLDAAATACNTKCRVFLRNALTDEAWPRGPVWLNPPYSKCREFLAKATAEVRRGCTVVCLVPSRTDTRWWHECVWDRDRHRPRPGVEIRFLKGRLRFEGAPAGAPFPSVILIFRPAPPPEKK